ncbi:MAG: MotA/TolQ/ExbB proton channel family protein [Myxococcota bacterium]
MPTNLEDWAEFYQQGGVLMHGILAMAVIGLGLVLERSWRLVVGQNVNVRRLMPRVQSRLLAGDTAGALRLCTSSRSVVHRVIRAGLMEGVDPERAAAAVREEQRGLEPGLRRWIPALSSIASIAMMIGLLGTILSLIGGFRCGIASVSAAQRAAALANEISIAVHTTGFGILVGILMLSARLWLVHTCEKLLADMALCGAKVVNLIRIVREPVPCDSPYR